jgi:hypothetical protein
MTEDRKAWCYISHKDGEWIAIMSAEPIAAENGIQQIRDFISDEVMAGREIETCYSREDYDAFLATKEMYRRPRKTA